MYTWHENLWFIFFACCWSKTLTESHELVGLGTVRYPVFSYHTLPIPKQCTETLFTHILTVLLIKRCLCDESAPPMGPYLIKKKIHFFRILHQRPTMCQLGQSQPYKQLTVPSSCKYFCSEHGQLHYVSSPLSPPQHINLCIHYK